MIDPEGLLIASRFVLDGAAVCLWGISAYLLTLPASPLHQDLVLRWSGPLTLAFALAVFSLASQLPLKAAILGTGWRDMADTSLMWRIASQTTTGFAWSVSAGTLMLSTLVQALIPARRLEVLALTSMALLASLALSGHSAMHDGWLGYAHHTNQWLHLLSGGFWLGALLPVISTLRALHSSTLRPAAIQGLIRFSRMGHWAVTVVVITGAFNTLLILGTLPLDWSQNYQWLLACKIGLVIGMISIAFINRYWLVPKLAGRASIAKALAWMTCLEVILATIVLALVVTFSTLNPH